MRIARGVTDLALGALVAIGAVGIAGLGSIGGLGARAFADPASDPRIAKADRLFAEGKALLESNLLQACAKFEESLHENPAAIGTLLNVALCDEKLGRVASAVARFSEARVRAKEQNLPEHIRAAEEHLAALTPAVPHLTIKLTETLPETKVLVDDALIAPGAIGSVAVDPGERVIVVSAPGRLPYRAKLVVKKAEHQDVVVPPLARSVTVKSSQLLIGQITVIAGGVAAGAGLGFGLYARHLYRQQFDSGECTRATPYNLCSAKGQRETDRAHTIGNAGTVIGVAGVLAAGAGAYLWYRSPKSTPADTSSKQLAIVPELRSDGVGLVALGRF